MEIGEIIEIGEREIVVSPRREAPERSDPQPAKTPEKEREDA